jgi:uncharacterized protein YggE
MNDEGSPLLSVRAEARQLVAPDYAVVDGLIEHTEGSKAEAVRSVTGSLDRLTAAVGKARDYAAALGATVRHVEHIADAGLLGGDTAPYHTTRSMAFRATSGGGDQPGTPALTPVPQELIATIEARFRTTDVSLLDA